MIRLGVNIDHVATLRQARRENFPDPIRLAFEAVQAGAQGITAHLREDRRHIQDSDIFQLKKHLKVPLNMEMAIQSSVMKVAQKVRPAWVCLVPEKREELTTEGGLDLKRNFKNIEKAVKALQARGIKVSLFIDPRPKSILLSRRLGVEAVEFHTGRYAQLWGSPVDVRAELIKIKESATIGRGLGLIINAGHGLNLQNVAALAKTFSFHEFNIGFSIISRSLQVGLAQSVKEMKKRMVV